MAYKHKLPKIEKPNGTYFVTFATWDRLELSPDARQIVLDSCLFFHEKRYYLYSVVVMPDHAHLLIKPYPKDDEYYWSLGSILHSIKSYSAKQIPRVMKHIGKVWQDGRYDRLIRDRAELLNTWEYIRQNPVKASLCSLSQDYQFFWEVF